MSPTKMLLALKVPVQIEAHQAGGGTCVLEALIGLTAPLKVAQFPPCFYDLVPTLILGGWVPDEQQLV